MANCRNWCACPTTDLSRSSRNGSRGRCLRQPNAGKPDAFLARELTEGVLHFLAVDATGNDITTADIAWVVVKVVRELGHPDLARAFEERKQDASRFPPTAIFEKRQDPLGWLTP